MSQQEKNVDLVFYKKTLVKLYQQFRATKAMACETELRGGYYNIIKPHGDELKVETKKGEFAGVCNSFTHLQSLLKQMKLFYLIVSLALSFSFSNTYGQQKIVDSLTQALHTVQNDTVRLVLYKQIGNAFEELNYDSSLAYARLFLQVSQKLQYRLYEADAFLQIAMTHVLIASSANALELVYKAQDILEEEKNHHKLLPRLYLNMQQLAPILQTPKGYRLYLLGKLNQTLAYIYVFNGDQQKVRKYIAETMMAAEALGAADLLNTSFLILGINTLNTPDTALYYLKKGYEHGERTEYKKNVGHFYNYMSKAYHDKNNPELDLHYKREALLYNLQQGNIIFSGWSYLSLADFYKETTASDSNIFYCQRALEIAQKAHSTPMEFWSSAVLKDTYRALNKKDSAFGYLERMVKAKEKMSSEQEIRNFQAVEYNRELQQQTAEKTRIQYQNKVRMYALSTGLVFSILVAALLWRNNQHRKKAYALLEYQKTKTEQALQELKETQSQLVQREKMASLGELTAGIAHEIQNPLNFVNNFSEVSRELMGEMEDALQKDDKSEALVIASDIKENLQKINHHGNRADAIVKGMLQHSRASTGKKEPTDINGLADEYLRLSYHGLRAKDKDFNANFTTHFDESIGKIEVVPQDIGRVLLNLYNNAFYAVNEKKKQLNGTFEPSVEVTTRKLNGKIELSVRDDGTGIPQKVLDKIYQPFFTTKPTGQGTGLGLSLTYDIIKAHGGELKVETKEGEGAEFTIQLPA